MTIYKAMQGSWRDGDSAKLIRESNSRKEILEVAQNTANLIGKSVKVSVENGMKFSFFTVFPEKI